MAPRFQAILPILPRSTRSALAVALVGVALLAGLGIVRITANLSGHRAPVASAAQSHLLVADVSPNGGTTQGGGS
jgi:hypothetical protein